MQATHHKVIVLALCSLFFCGCVSTAQKANVEISIVPFGIARNVDVVVHGTWTDSDPWQCVKDNLSQRFKESDVPTPEIFRVFLRSIYRQKTVAEISLTWQIIKINKAKRAEMLLGNIQQIDCQ
ncbi:MAG: hypothetical protein COU51_00145 [Parcubacteria group bacterium CG10_big_fil_rev_8_21_14_0_10_36_14]|nr:MAG: hypothetical protein COU51_00145 [Parcubacteria group bacterium CG10_big_fil_rev_8_21_14_0_10_36_14]